MDNSKIFGFNCLSGFLFCGLLLTLAVSVVCTTILARLLGLMEESG